MFPPKQQNTYIFKHTGNLFRKDHTLGHKINLKISRIFSYLRSVKLKINYKKKTENFSNIYRLNNIQLSYSSNQESKRKTKEK